MKKILVLVLTIICLLSIDKVYAKGVSAESFICGSENQYTLKKRAAEVKISYHFESEGDRKYFHLKVANMQPDLEMRIGYSTYKYTENSNSFDIVEPFGVDGETVTINFYGMSPHPCRDQYISTTTIKLPKYNRYSELDECVEYEEFPLCQRFYNGTIKNYQEFKTKLDEYIKSINGDPLKPKNPSFFDKIRIFLEDNPIIVALFIIVVIAAIIALIIFKIFKRKKRAKIKL